jgi:hypothetical protein
MNSNNFFAFIFFEAFAVGGLVTAFQIINPLLQCILLSISIWAAIKALRNANKLKTK